MLHNQLLNEEQQKQWQKVYDEIADAANVSFRMFLCVIEDVQEAAHKTKSDLHALPLLMMMEFAEAIAGVECLIRSGMSKNCLPLLRTALEIQLELKWILDSDATYSERCLAREYFQILGGLRQAQRYDKEHPAGINFQQEIKGHTGAEIFDLPKKTVKDRISQLEGLTASDRYDIVRAEITRMETPTAPGKKPRRVDCWYSLWGGPQDVYNLAKRLNELPMYEAFYRPWSQSAHGAGSLRIVGRSGDKTDLLPIGSPADLNINARNLCLLANGLSLFLVGKIIPRRMDDLRSHYINHVKPALALIERYNIRTGKQMK